MESLLESTALAREVAELHGRWALAPLVVSHAGRASRRAVAAALLYWCETQGTGGGGGWLPTRRDCPRATVKCPRCFREQGRQGYARHLMAAHGVPSEARRKPSCGSPRPRTIKRSEDGSIEVRPAWRPPRWTIPVQEGAARIDKAGQWRRVRWAGPWRDANGVTHTLPGLGYVPPCRGQHWAIYRNPPGSAQLPHDGDLPLLADETFRRPCDECVDLELRVKRGCEGGGDEEDDEGERKIVRTVAPSSDARLDVALAYRRLTPEQKWALLRWWKRNGGLCIEPDQAAPKNETEREAIDAFAQELKKGKK